MTSTENRRRGGALTTFLALLTAFQVLGLVLVVGTWTDAASHGQDVGALGFFSVLLCLLALTGFAAVWAWRRWGVVLLAVVAAIGLVTDLAAGLAPLALLIRLALLAGLFASIASRWDDFR
jgi:hypothetical protein